VTIIIYLLLFTYYLEAQVLMVEPEWPMNHSENFAYPTPSSE